MRIVGLLSLFWAGSVDINKTRTGDNSVTIPQNCCGFSVKKPNFRTILPPLGTRVKKLRHFDEKLLTFKFGYGTI